MRRIVLTSLAATLLLLCAAAPAEANSAYASFGFGSGIKMVKSNTQFKVTQELGMHLQGWSSGFALAIAFAESFGDDIVVFQVGPRFVWDIPVARRFVIGPFLQPGYALRAPSGGEADHFFNLQLGFAMKLLLPGRLLLFFQPFGLDMHFADPVWMRYDLVGGLGLRF